MRIILIVVILICALALSCQVNWDKTSNWRLYRYQGNDLFNISIDSLHSFQNTPLSQDSMINYLLQAKIKHPKAAIHWMGGYIATCQFNGSYRKVVFSNYGGFFYDEKARMYYQLSPENTDAWLSFLQNSYITMIKNHSN